ncbi:hypothetical protein M2167_000305 [Streptomyces sp. SPB4]|nr:hypothetical protein [Streptomyces sp. SPB4]
MPTVAEIVQERGCTRKVARAALWYLEKTWFVSAAIGSEYRGRYVVARQYAGRGDA